MKGNGHPVSFLMSECLEMLVSYIIYSFHSFSPTVWYELHRELGPEAGIQSITLAFNMEREG